MVWVYFGSILDYIISDVLSKDYTAIETYRDPAVLFVLFIVLSLVVSVLSVFLARIKKTPEEIEEEERIKAEQEIRALRDRLSLIESQINDYNTKINELRDKIAEEESRITSAETKLKQNFLPYIEKGRLAMQKVSALLSRLDTLLAEKQSFFSPEGLQIIRSGIDVIKGAIGKWGNDLEIYGASELSTLMTNQLTSNISKFQRASYLKDIDDARKQIDKLRKIVESYAVEYDTTIPLLFLENAKEILNLADGKVSQNELDVAKKLVEAALELSSKVREIYDNLPQYGYMLKAIKQEREKYSSF